MRRVVVSGMGIVSCLGNDIQTVLESLKQGRSGIKLKQEYVDMGMRSHIAGSVDIDTSEHIDRKVKRFMGDAAAFAYCEAYDARRAELGMISMKEYTAMMTGGN